MSECKHTWKQLPQSMTETINIIDGKHAGEIGVVIKEYRGIKEVLTLEGDVHIYDSNGKEQKK